MTARTSIAIAAALLSGAAHAVNPAPLTANQMLQQFNVVVSGKVTSTSHVDGRTYVGGDVAGGIYASHANTMPASAYAGLTVGGNLDGAKALSQGAVVAGNVTNSEVNNGGQSYIGGNASNSSLNGEAWVVGAANHVEFGKTIHAASYSNMNLNNKILAAPTATMNSTLAASASTNFSSVMTGLSSQLSALKGTAGTSVSFTNNNHDVTFKGTGVNGVLVFDLTALDTQIFSSTTTDLHFDLSGASTVIFNTNDKTLNLTANFNQAQSLGSELIWNFAGAGTSVTVGRTFGGQVLVADGTFSNVGGANVEGGVYAKTLNQFGEIHQQAFSGNIPTAPVPEPETYAMLLAGLGVMGMLARRRRK